MKKSTNLLWLIMLALCMSLSSCVDDSDVVNPGEKDPDFKYIIVMSDIHVMAPEETTEMLRGYLGDQLTGIFMIYNDGNEWKNPAAAVLENQLKSNLENMLRDRAAVVGLNNIQTDVLVNAVTMLYLLRLEPGIKSMITDVNQYMALDSRLRSRTDDLNAVLRIGR